MSASNGQLSTAHGNLKGCETDAVGDFAVRVDIDVIQ